MIIDTHTHIFPNALAARALTSLAEHSGSYKPHTDGTLKSLLRSMDEAGISTSWIANIATKPAHTASIIAWSKEIACGRIFPLASVYPHSETWEKDIEAIINAGMYAVKLHPMYQNFFVDDHRLEPFFSMLEENDMLVLFHAGYDIGFGKNDYAAPKRIRKLLDKHPRLTLIAAHLGGWDIWEEVISFLAGTPCYFDTSFSHEVNPVLFEEIIAKHGTERLVFASDSPWLNQKAQADFITTLGFSKEEKEAVFFRNASALQLQYSSAHNSKVTK